jgi:cation diffusion facilitator CzcD-associated flavoprotein CzcO
VRFSFFQKITMIERPRRVAVVGAGVSGVITAAHLKAEGLDVAVFERAPVSGGIWSVYQAQGL